MSASSERRRSKRKKERLLPIPEHYQDHLQFVLWPREKVLYQERPRRAAIARRYPPFLALAVLALWLLPLCGLLPASMMYYNGADWWITLLPLTLLPLDLVLVVALVWWWRQLEYCFVLTERRVMTFRHGMLGCSAELHMEERDIQDFADDLGFKLGKYADGSGSVEVPGFERVAYVSSIQKVEECALRALEGSPTYMAQDQRLLPILAWGRRIFVSLLVPALLLLLIPAIASVALEAIHEQQVSEEGSPDTALWWLPNILFTVLFGVAYALSVSASIAVTVWSTQGYKGTWILQSRSEHEMEAGTDMVREQSAEGVAAVDDEAPLAPEDLEYTVGDPIQDADDVFRD